MRFSRARAAAARELERPLEPPAPRQVLELAEPVDAGVVDSAPVAEAPGVATSLATVGYAMFALLRRGDLADLGSFDAFLDRSGSVTSSADAEAGLTAEPEGDGVFGAAQVDHHFAAVARPATLADPLAASPTRANLHLVGANDSLEAIATRTSPEQPLEPLEPLEPRPVTEAREPAAGPQRVPADNAPGGFRLPPVDASITTSMPPAPTRTSNTLAMLQEISFLDE